jgi:hypothetical protein
MMLARAGGLLLSRQTLRAARFLCRMRITASSARRFNSASSGVNRKNSKRRLLISSSPVFFVPSFLYSTRRAFSRAAGFRYLSIAPVFLGPGTYTIGGFYGAPLVILLFSMLRLQVLPGFLTLLVEAHSDSRFQLATYKASRTATSV